MNGFAKKRPAIVLLALIALVAAFALMIPCGQAAGEEPGGAERNLTVGTMRAHAEGALSGDALDGATVRIRPKGSYSALAINQDGSGVHNVVHMFHIGGSSRFYLEKADDSTYKIHYYSSFTAKNFKSDVFDIDGPSKKEGAVIHLAGDGDKSNKRWQFIQQADGTYHIYSMYSEKYWSLKDGDIDKDNNKLCQSSTAMDWEIEIVAMDDASKLDEAKRNYDSYTFEHNDGSADATVASTNWMGCLSDNDRLSDLSIPGVHDAGTCNISTSGMAGDYRCQQFYIDDLLNNGVRYFDLRLVNSGGTLKLRHGSDALGAICKDHNGDDLTLDTVMGWIGTFLAAHPNETVILQLKDESDKDTASTDIYNYFSNLAKQENSPIYSGNGTPTLHDVRGKIVLISRISTDKAGGDYYIDPNDHERGSWAIYADWQQGSDYETAKAADTDAYEVWTQDKYNLKPSDKWTWIKKSLFGQGGAIGAKARHDQVEQTTTSAHVPKKAWIVNYTSCESLGIPNYDPQDCARDIDKWLKQSGELGTHGKTYMGIVCCDFIDEQLAQRIYAINFRYNPDERMPQQVKFENDHAQKAYGDNPFTDAATSTGNGTISYTSSDSHIATVDAASGQVTIHGAGTVLITATAAETDDWLQGSGSYTLAVDKASVTVTADDKTSVYGTPLKELTFAVTDGNLKYDDTIDVLGIAVSSTAEAGSDAGDYPISLSIEEENPSYDVTLVDGTYTISKAPAPSGVTGPTARNDLTYDGSDQGLVIAPAALPDGYVRIEYSTDDGKTWAAPLPTGKAAGTYAIRVRYVGDGNHEDFEGDPLKATIAPAGDGKVDTRIVLGKGAPKTSSPNLDEVAGALLSDAEKEAVANGAAAKVWLEVSILDEADIPSAGKSAMARALSKLDAKIDMWLNISLFKEVTGFGTSAIEKTPQPVTLSVEVPDSLRSKDARITRTFYLLSLHDGATAVIAQGTGAVLSGGTDRFSPYALASMDKTASESAGTGSSKGAAAKTGDQTPVAPLAILALGALSAVALLGRRIGRKSDSGK